MLPTDICRTCALHNVNLLALSTRTTKYANKSLCDILHELTQNDPLMEHQDDNLPQQLCDDCLRKLEAAYAFVLQARQVHEQLLHKLRKGLQCLDEAPIDIATSDIKTETEADLTLKIDNTPAAALDVVTAKDIVNVSVAALKIQPDTESDSDSDSNAEAVDNVDLKPMERRRSSRKAKHGTGSDNEEICDTSNLIPLKRRRGRPARVPKKEAVTKDGRHACNVCGKTFSWYRDMQRHARVHYEQAAYECETCGKRFLRKDKYSFHLRSHEKRKAKQQAAVLQLGNEWRFAERLYSAGRLKRVECKLCNLKCQKIEELREHLTSQHTSIESLSQLSLNSDVVREHFDNQMSSLEQIKQQVCADILMASDQLEKYCMVINAHGYELSLNDSDEELATANTPYHCVPCNMSFTRKHCLMRHTLKKHTQSFMQRCNTCQIGFMCERVLEQHQRTQCLNQLRPHSCPNCPGKFMWLQNLKQHACIKEKERASHFQCCLCSEQLLSMATLRSHLLKHSDGRSGIDINQSAAYFRCLYPDGVTCSETELSARIASDFEAQDYGQYFNACTGSGREMDYFDSDTGLSDAELPTTSRAALHSCALCDVATARLGQLLRHQEEYHSDVTNSMPHVCVRCGLGFVAESLLQQHLRRSCGKRHAKYHCQQCNLHFIWQSNFERHMDAKHELDTEEDQEQTPNTRLRSKRQQTAKLQCNQCDKVFIWPKDLTRHKRIHQPQATAQFECNFCERKFHRKDGLKSHLRVHSEQQLDATSPSVDQLDSSGLQRIPAVLSQLCRPNGCKQIQCMICLSQHTKISDLRAHLVKHQYSVEFTEERAKPESIASICRGLYPEQVKPLDRQQLIERIQRDVGKGKELERFVSITNEAAIELSLDSSETETDSDSAEPQRTGNGRQYNCDLCQLQLTRKHQLYEHQLQQHTWQEATLMCSHCQAKFINEQLLEHHYRTLCRNVQKRFLCRKCPLRFRWRDNLKLHMDVAHQEVAGEQSSLGIQVSASSLLPVVSYDCQECNRSFKMQKDLTRHTLMHAQESSIYRCRWCARRFYRETNLLQHIERHGITATQLPYAEALLNASRHPHGQKCIECKVCDVRFPTIASLRAHLLSTESNGSHHDVSSMLNYSITNQLGFELHLDDSETDEETKPAGVPMHYTCGMCHLRCVRKYELYQHQQAMHRLERIAEGCDQCIYKSVSPDLIAYHRRVQCDNTEKQFKCAKCNYKFMWESNLLKHTQLQHPSNDIQEVEEATLELPQAECQIFQCGQCPRKYNRKDRLTAHVKKCHAPGDVSSTGGVSKAEKVATVAKQHKSFLCAFCGKAVSSSSNLIIHIRRHTGEKPFKCDYCDMAFPRSSDLQCHRRTHTGERPHVCTVCQKGFARSYKLQQHMRIHNGERPYKCTYCEKSFTQSNDLTLHIRRHTGERPYQCETCGERFIQGTALKNHRLQNGHFETGDGIAKDN